MTDRPPSYQSLLNSDPTWPKIRWWNHCINWQMLTDISSSFQLLMIWPRMKDLKSTKKSWGSKTEGKGRDGGIHLAGKRCPWLTESCQVKTETVVSTWSTTDKFTIMYSNADSLPNKKKQELVALINNAPCKPKLIASELAIPGYNIYSNNLNIKL